MCNFRWKRNSLHDLISSIDFADARSSITSSSESMRKTCAFCIKDHTLLKSHFIPACVLRRIGQDIRTYEVSEGAYMNTRNASSQENRWARLLFCQCCEEGFFGKKFEEKINKNMQPIHGIKRKNADGKRATLLLSKSTWFDDVDMSEFESCDIPRWDREFWATIVFRSILATAGNGLTNWEVDYVLRLHKFLIQIRDANGKNVDFPLDFIKMSILIDYNHPVVFGCPPKRGSGQFVGNYGTALKNFLLSVEYDLRFFVTGMSYGKHFKRTGAVEDKEVVRLRVGHLTVVFGPGLKPYYAANKIIALPKNDHAKAFVKHEFYPYAKQMVGGPGWNLSAEDTTRVKRHLEELHRRTIGIPTIAVRVLSL